MPRKRKIAVNIDKIDRQLNEDRKEMMLLLCQAQKDEQSYHKKLGKKLRELYERMKHDDFNESFIKCLKILMQSDGNQFTKAGLTFMARFTSSFQAEEMHPLFDSILQWILKTISLNVGIRLRLCEFVNEMLDSLPDGGEIEEYQCDEILSYMMERLKDISPNVRVQAIKALCRLQNINDPTDEVTKIFLFHLTHDPSAVVRQAVIASIARSQHTVPYILERLYDVDYRVRRSVVARMTNFPFNRCTVEERLTLIEQGLADCSETVRNIVLNIMLPQWLALYDNDFIKFVSSLKSDRNYIEMCRFRRVARMALVEMFRSHEPSNLVNVLPLVEASDDTECDKYHRCIQLDKITPELSVFWISLIEFWQNDEEKNFELIDKILPDLTTMCNYIARFIQQINPSHDKVSTQCISVTLIEMLRKIDLSEETGRESVKNIVVNLLACNSCNEDVIESLVKICEQLIPTPNHRLQFYVDMVKIILHPMEEPLLSSEMDSHVRDELEISPKSDRFNSKKLVSALQFIFHGVCSDTVKHLVPSMFQFYKDTIRDRVECDDVEIRNWALKCMATFSLLCKELANDAYHVCCKQLLSHHVKSIWITSIKAIFQLINRYGFHFTNIPSLNDELPRSDSDEEFVSTTEILQLFDQYLDTQSHDADITCELVDGFCALTVHGRFFDEKIMTKLVVMFFNETIEPKIIQILSIFFETLIRLKKQKYFELSLFETLDAITIDKTCADNKLRFVLKFVVQSTNEIASNAMAVVLLTWMISHKTDHKSLNVAAKVILSLKLSEDDESSTIKLNSLADQLLQEELHVEAEKNLRLFKKMLTQSMKVTEIETLQFSSTRPADGVEADEISYPDENGDMEIENCNDPCPDSDNNNEIRIVNRN